MVKLWAAVDVLLIGAIILLTRRGKLRRSFVAGVVMGGCALGLPFFLAAPNRMWRMIVSTQLGRPHEGMTLLGRLEYFGPGPTRSTRSCWRWSECWWLGCRCTAWWCCSLLPGTAPGPNTPRSPRSA